MPRKMHILSTNPVSLSHFGVCVTHVYLLPWFGLLDLKTSKLLLPKFDCSYLMTMKYEFMFILIRSHIKI